MCPYLKQSEDLRDAVLQVRTVGTSYGPWVKLAYRADIVGSARYSLLHCGPRRRPRKDTWNAAEHRLFYGSSTGGIFDVWKAPYLTNPAKVVYQLQGDLAGAMSLNGHEFLELTSFGAENQATLDAASKLLEPDVDYGVMIAEAADTLRMITSPFNAIARKLLKLKPRKRMRRRNALEYASNKWLETRYGILPTINDANAIVQEVNRELTTPVKTLRKGASVKGPSALSGSSGISSLGSTFQITGSQKTTKEDYIISNLFYNLVDVEQAERSRLGLDLTNLPGFLWETTPFSFVLDWGFNIGSWLNAVTPSPQYQKLAQTCSLVRTRSDVYQTYMISLRSSTPLWSPAVSRCEKHFKSYRRDLVANLPALPSVNYSILNFKRSLDAAALSYQPIRNTLTKLF